MPADPRIIDVELDLLDATDPDDPAHSDGIDQLIESLKERDNLVPILLSAHPKSPGRYEIQDGHRRVHGLRHLGKKTARAIVLAEPVGEREQIELYLLHNGLRKTLGAADIASRAERYMELTGASQREAAERLKISPAKLSRDLNDAAMPPEFREATKGLAVAVRQLFLPVRDKKVRDAAIAFARTPLPGGKLPSRDDVALYLKRAIGAPNKAKRPKTAEIKARQGSVVQGLRLRADAPITQVIEELKGLVTAIAKHQDLPTDVVVAILNGRGRPAA
jgi:ParB/RepB/Spo0J family partition protein